MSDTIMSRTMLTAVVVNDDPTQLKVLSALVRKTGLDPRAFTTAEAALTEMDPNTLPALVVTDLYMPGIDGWRFCRLLRSPEYAAFNQIPILVVSATFTGEEPNRIAADLGAEAFLPSPVDGKNFVEQVLAILDGRQARPPLRVLIVEDSKTQSEIIKTAFSRNGYQTDTAFTARDATEAFAKTAYDVTVLDYHLPDGTGDALLDAFRTAQPDCVCLMMTTDPTPSLALEWMKKGAAAYLRKPFEPGYLIELCLKARRERALLRAQDLLEVRTRELRESEEKFRELVENLNDAIFELDADGTITYISPPVFQLTGHVPDELIGRAFRELIHPEDPPSLERGFLDLLQNQLEPREFRYRTKDGQWGWARTSSRPVLKGGRVVGARGMFSDITNFKRAEDALRESNDLFSLYMHHSPVYTYIKSVTPTESRVLQASDNFRQMIGLAGCEMVGKTMEELFPSELAKKITADDWAVVAKGDVLKQDEELNGRSYATIKFPIVQGAKTLLAGFTIDITERKRAEDALRASKERLRAVLDATPFPIAVVDMQDNAIDFWSRSALRIFGHTAPTASEWYQIAYPDPAYRREVIDRWKPFLEIARQSERSVNTGEYRVSCSDGSVRICELHAAFLPESLIVTFNDITERKRAEEEQKRLQNQLQQAMKMEAVGRLAGGIAHDFNNLLTGITCNVSLVLMDLKPDDPHAESLSEAREAAERAATLTRQLLAFSRKQLIEPKVVNLNDIISSLHQMLVRLIGEDIELQTIPTQQLGSVIVDPAQFEQIVVNLAINARDSMPTGGKLVIETANVELNEDYCRLHSDTQPGNFVMLVVSDTGHGMSEEVRQHLFEPFFTTKPKGRGTGLGLATICGAVKQAGGSIDVYSEVDHGTSFKIYLPQVKQEAEKIAVSTRVMDLPRGNETILLVEDEAIVKNTTMKFLKRLGYGVLHASDGNEALVLADRHQSRIDLLLTDVVMPGMNGRQLAERLVSIHPEIKILFTSGYTENVIAHHGVLDEGLSFIGKPYTPQALAMKIREVLGAGARDSPISSTR